MDNNTHSTLYRLLEIQKSLEHFRPSPALVLASEAAAKLQALEKIVPFIPKQFYPVPQSLLEKIGRCISNGTAYANQFEGISQAAVALQELNEAIKRRSTFKAYEIDFGDLDTDEELIHVRNEERSVLKSIIWSIYQNNEHVLTLHPREFEKVIAEILYSQGFEVELTKQTRDNGYDILAIKNLQNQSPLKFLVECKRFTKRKVGVEIIRSFKEVIQTEKANKGIIVTTSYFSLDAIKKQKEIPYLLDFRDKDNLLDWVNEYCFPRQ